MKRILFLAVVLFFVAFHAIGLEITVWEKNGDEIHIIKSNHIGDRVEFIAAAEYANNTGLPVVYPPVEGDAAIRFNLTYFLMSIIYETDYVHDVLSEYYTLPSWHPSSISPYLWSMQLITTDLSEQNDTLARMATDPENWPVYRQIINNAMANVDGSDITIQLKLYGYIRDIKIHGGSLALFVGTITGIELENRLQSHGYTAVN